MLITRDRIFEGSAAPIEFDYGGAFSRNLGWLTEREQIGLRQKTVAIAGMGGVGGNYLLTLARLGIQAFHIADLDHFEIANFNRQVGARVSTLGLPKVDVMADMARDINPDIRIRKFTTGVSSENLDSFLERVDLFVDGLDFFALDIRMRVFARCHELGIPAITAAPVGMGTSYIVFMPGGMVFERYFGLNGCAPEERQFRFLMGVNPTAFHRPYLVDRYRVDLAAQRVPSTIAGCQLCAGVVAAQAVKILLARGGVRAAPWYHTFDAYRGKHKSARLYFGGRNPLLALKRTVARRQFAHVIADSQSLVRSEPSEAPDREIERILDLARWAPSGDNGQPWRLVPQGEHAATVAVRAARAGELYEFDRGRPTLLSAGFLLESIRLAATRFGRDMDWQYSGERDGEHRLLLRLPRRPGIAEDPLLPYLRLRSVNRRPLRTNPLSSADRQALEQSLGDRYAVRWYESSRDRWRAARVNAMATHLRLVLPEAYEVHRRIIDWRRRFSPNGVPARAIGLDPMTLRLMRWLMHDWRRVAVAGKYFAGTVVPRLELDILPGVLCAAHFAIHWRHPPVEERIPSLFHAGMALQRFWLTATGLGLDLQPSFAPLCFAYYAGQGEAFSERPGAAAKAHAIRSALSALLGRDSIDCLFLGRLGRRREACLSPRSIRRPLAELMTDSRSYG